MFNNITILTITENATHYFIMGGKAGWKTKTMPVTGFNKSEMFAL